MLDRPEGNRKERILVELPRVLAVANDGNRQAKKIILVAFTLVVVGLVGGFVAIDFWERKTIHKREISRTLKAVERFFLRSLEGEALEIHAAFHGIMENERARRAFLDRDREGLMQWARPLYHQLHHHHQITHFYFTEPDRRNWLRVHKPSRHGDIIDRFTTLEAERTGKSAQGLELGPLGTLTLRVVMPWHDDGRLIGFLELGKEINHIIEGLHDVLEIDLMVLIHKKHLRREGWEQGMSLFGHSENWDRFTNTVIASRTIDPIPDPLDAMAAEGGHPQRVPISFEDNGDDLMVAFIPMLDARGEEIGDFVIIRNMTSLNTEFERMTWLFVMGAVALGGVMSALFFGILTTLERHTEKANREVEIHRRDQEVVAAIMEISQAPIPLAEKLERSLSRLLSSHRLGFMNQGSIFLVDEDGEHLNMVAQQGLHEHLLSACSRVPFGHCLCGRAAQSEQIEFADAIDHRHDTVYDGIAPHGHYCVPIKSDGELLGVLNLYVPEGFQRDPAYEQFVSAVSDGIANMIRRDRAETGLEEAHKREIALRGVMENVGDCLIIHDFDGNILTFNRAAVNSFGYTPDELENMSFADLMEEMDVDEYLRLWKTVTPDTPLTSEYRFRRKDGSAFIMESQLGMFHAALRPLMIVTARDITDRKKEEKRIHHSATHDTLTDLPNRALFMNRLEKEIKQARRTGSKVIVLFVDLDGFKNVNDSMGHHAGDLLLLQVAKRLKSSVRDVDMVARYGGDEFVIVLKGSMTRKAVSRVAETILAALSEPFALDEGQASIGASIGIAVSVR